MSTFYTTFLSKSDFSFALFLVTFEPLEIQQSNIPLLKALKCGINAVGAQGRNCMSTFCHAPLKIALLLHKMANECKQAVVAVHKSGNPYVCVLRPGLEIFLKFKSFVVLHVLHHILYQGPC